jgi:predicted naringenin-chalcone synthase
MERGVWGERLKKSFHFKYRTKKMRLFYKNAGISQRHSVLADYNCDNHFTFFKDIPHTFPTTAQRMEVYEKNALPLAIEAFENLRQKHAIDISQITHLISVSCTGMYARALI